MLAKPYALKLEKNSEILELRNKVTKLENQFTEHVIYSCKDLNILGNLPSKHSKESLLGGYVSSLTNLWTTKHSRVASKNVISWDRAQAANQQLSSWNSCSSTEKIYGRIS